MRNSLAMSVVALSLVFVMPAGKIQAASGKASAKPATDSAAAQERYISGKVVETMNSAGYTYVCLEQNSSKTWVAVPEMKVIKGQDMSFYPGAEMLNFESKTLKRKFERIVFSSGPADIKAVKKGMKTQAVKDRPSAAAEKIKVDKATGSNAYSIAEIYKNRKSLDKKKVVLRGKVVKVSAGIMNRNWIHVQDGTGDAKKGSNNLVVTSQSLPSVGEVVTISGTLHNDKDFGGGYRYSVIIENAGLKK